MGKIITILIELPYFLNLKSDEYKFKNPNGITKEFGVRVSNNLWEVFLPNLQYIKDSHDVAVSDLSGREKVNKLKILNEQTMNLYVVDDVLFDVDKLSKILEKDIKLENLHARKAFTVLSWKKGIKTDLTNDLLEEVLVSVKEMTNHIINKFKLHCTYYFDGKKPAPDFRPYYIGYYDILNLYLVVDGKYFNIKRYAKSFFYPLASIQDEDKLKIIKNKFSNTEITPNWLNIYFEFQRLRQIQTNIEHEFNLKPYFPKFRIGLSIILCITTLESLIKENLIKKLDLDDEQIGKYHFTNFFRLRRHSKLYFEKGYWNLESVVIDGIDLKDNLYISDILEDKFGLNTQERVELIKKVYHLYEIRNNLVHGRYYFNEIYENLKEHFEKFDIILNCFKIKYQIPEFQIDNALKVNPLGFFASDSTGGYTDAILSILFEKDLYSW